MEIMGNEDKNKIEDTAQNIRIWLSLMLAILPSYVNMEMVKNIYKIIKHSIIGMCTFFIGYVTTRFIEIIYFLSTHDVKNIIKQEFLWQIQNRTIIFSSFEYILITTLISITSLYIIYNYKDAKPKER